MRMVLRCSQLLAILFAAVTAIAATAVISDTADPCLRLRAAPHADAHVVKCLPPGTTVEVLEQAPYWRKVSVGNVRGWAAKKFLTEPTGPEVAETTGNPWLEVHVVDVGQGDGIWIHTADDGIANGRFEGRNIVIDGGPAKSDDKSPLLEYLLEYAHPGAVIDTLLVTHPHDDHYPGATNILRNFDVKSIYDPGYPKDGPKYAAFLALARKESGATVMVGRDTFQPLDWGNELTAEILYSYPGTNTGLGSGNTLENNASIVLRVQYGSQVLLFMGDAEGKEKTGDPATPRYMEKILLDNDPDKLKATVLKVGHHGSETSSTIPFINAVDPQIVIVSSGRKAFSGTYLPRQTTLQRYCDHNTATRIYRTDQDDEAEGRTTQNDADNDHIVIRTDGTNVEVSALSNGHPITITTCDPGPPN